MLGGYPIIHPSWEVISYSLEKPLFREDILLCHLKYIFSGLEDILLGKVSVSDGSFVKKKYLCENLLRIKK